MRKLKLLLIIGLIGLTQCKKNDELPSNKLGEFRLEKTQEVFFTNGYSTGAYGDVLYDQYCDELVIFFITEDSIGISPESTCGVDDYSLFRWSYDLIDVADIQDANIKSKYEQVSEISQAIRYYPDSSLADQYKGYFGVYDKSDYALSLMNYDGGILHFSEL